MIYLIIIYRYRNSWSGEWNFGKKLPWKYTPN